jgi:hypothetical protein
MLHNHVVLLRFPAQNSNVLFLGRPMQYLPFKTDVIISAFQSQYTGDAPGPIAYLAYHGGGQLSSSVLSQAKDIAESCEK